jgi:hypothetical protein
MNPTEDLAAHIELCAFCQELEEDYSGLNQEDVERLQQHHFEEWEAEQVRAAQETKFREWEGD